ncbi:MAG: hypothetical protein AB7V14_10480 [Kiritimatiellia bacterium]
MKKTVALFLAMAAIGAAVQAGEAPPVLGILEIRGIDNLAGAVFELTQAAGQPVPREMVTMGIYGALGTMSGMGIQPNGTLRALWLDDGSAQGTATVLLPVENDGADYLASLGQAGWTSASETADGLLHFAPPASGPSLPFGEVYFLKNGQTLIAGDRAQTVRQTADALATLPPILPVEGVVAVQLRPAAIAEAFGPLVREQMDKAFLANPEIPGTTAAMGNLYADAYLAAARQVQDATLGLGVSKTHLGVHARLVPAANTTLSAWFDTVRSPSPKANVVNLPDALFVETAHMGNLELLADPYFRFAETTMASAPAALPAEQMRALLGRSKASWAQMAGDFGFALLPPTKERPLRFAEYVAAKDSAAMRALAIQTVQNSADMFRAALAAAAAETGAPAPFEFAVAMGEPREYRGIPVDSVTYRLTLQEPILSFWPEGLPTEIAAEMAWLPDGLLMGSGGPELTDALVDRALDGTGTPVAERESWKAFYPAPDPQTLEASHAALFDLVRAYAGLADEITGSAVAPSIPDGPGCLAAHVYRAAGGAMGRLRFRLSDISAIAQKWLEIKQKAMADRMAEFEQMQRDQEMEDFPGFDEQEDEDFPGFEEMDSSDFEEPESDAAEPEAEPAPVPAESPAE